MLKNLTTNIKHAAVGLVNTNELLRSVSKIFVFYKNQGWMFRLKGISHFRLNYNNIKGYLTTLFHV